MSSFTPEEIENITQALAQTEPSIEEKSKIPLRPPGSYSKLAKIELSPLLGDSPRPLKSLTEKELNSLGGLKTHIEVVFGSTKLSLTELAAIQEGSLIPLNHLCDDLVDIYANGKKVARGEIVAVDEHFGVKIVCFTKN